MEDVDTDWIEHQSKALEKRIVALSERAMRHTCLCEFVEALTPMELVCALHCLHTRAENGISPARIVIQEFALEPFALQSLPIEQLMEAYQNAMEKDWHYVANFFINTKTKRPHTVDEFFTGNEFMDIPLGNRRQAARTQDRFVIDRLVHDRDHRVIELLLNNPRITEQDVVSIAARRPTQPKILTLISQHRKWGSRYKIRKALCCNPYTPQSIASQLLSTLMLQDLRFLYNSGSIPTELRNMAQKLLQERKDLRGLNENRNDTIVWAEDTQNETDWESLFEEAHTALQNLGDIHNTTTTTLQEIEDATVVQTDEDAAVLDDDEMEALAKMAEMMLESATLIPVNDVENDDL